MAGLAPASPACPLCDSGELRATLELLGVPTQDGVLWHTEAEALDSPLGDIRLVLCERCSFVWNELHDPAKVVFRGYDVSLQHSPAFRDFVAGLAERLIERYGLRGKTVLDIGSGRGHFLEEICARGPNRGIGVDPSIESHRLEAPEIEFVGEAFDGRLLDLAADLYSCRHVVDILSDQRALVRLIGRAIERAGTGAVAYLEVPNALATFGGLVVWNLVYEHRAWFCADSLAYLLAVEGFEVVEVAPCWQGEYLGIEGRRPRSSPLRAVPAAASGVGAAVDRFAASFEEVRGGWQERLDELRERGRRAVIWGAGARGVAFVSLLDTADVVPYLVDVNPKRQGLYLPRSAHRVEAPQHLLADPPDLVVVSNPTYAEEIRAQARELGVRSEIDTL
jgi:SAM-dependent methyltransferase